MLAILLSIVIALSCASHQLDLESVLPRSTPLAPTHIANFQLSTLPSPSPHESRALNHFELDLSAAPQFALAIQQDSLEPTLSQSPDHQITISPDALPFGAADTSYWFIGLSGGIDFDERSAGRASVGLGYFIADHVSLDLDLAFCFFDQPGDNAFGVNTSLLLRWHFITDDQDKWSIYGEVGAGLLGATEDVPEHGTSFNFTPQVGAGFTFDLDGEDGGPRLFTGIRWYHVSNANTFEDNPAVDFTMIHATIAFPF